MGFTNSDLQIGLLCNKYKISYIGNSPFSKFYDTDKIVGKLLCQRLKIITPKYCLPYQLSEINFEGPCIIKPRFSASSKNLTDWNICTSYEELIFKIQQIDLPQDYFIEQYIQGKTVTLGCLLYDKSNVLVSTPYTLESKNNQIITFEDKKDGGCIKSVDLASNLKKRLYKAAKKYFAFIQPCQIARLDFMLDKMNRLYFLEINTTPNLSFSNGFVKGLLCEKVPTYADLINQLVSNAISFNK